MESTQNCTHLTPEQGQALLRLARATIGARLGLNNDSGLEISDPELADPVFQEMRGTFVTLKIKNQLRGCMGCLTPSETILAGIQRNALNSAFCDPRFPALTALELKKAAIEISILTCPQDLEYTDSIDLLAKIRPHVDGVIISKGPARATFLPQVWEQLPRPDDFMAQLCCKACLAPDEWRKGGLEVSIYQVQYFHEN